MKIEAHGILRHQFFGEYSCTVLLSFADAEAAESALPQLPGWKSCAANDHPHILKRTQGTPEEIEAQLRKIGTLAIEPCGWRHCKDQCAGASIGGLPHSVDVGPAFAWTTEATDPRQVGLF